MSNVEDFDTDAENDAAEILDRGNDVPQRKKSGGFVFKLVVIVIAMCIAGFIGTQYLKGAAMQPAASVGAPEMPADMVVNNAPVQPVAEDNLPSSPLDTQENMGTQALPAALAAEETLSIPGPVPSQTNDGPSEGAVLEGQGAPVIVALGHEVTPVADPLSAEPQASEPSPPTAAVPDPLEAVTAETEIQADQADAAAITATEVASVPSNETSADRIQVLEQRLFGVEEELANLRGTLAARSDIDALKDSLARLEDRLAQPVAASREKKASFKPLVRKKAVSVPKPIANWVLKSAKPGMAWVALQGSSELKVVTPGDMLEGIGKVTTIGKDSSGRWVVNGTQGQLTNR